MSALGLLVRDTVDVIPRLRADVHHQVIKALGKWCHVARERSLEKVVHVVAIPVHIFTVVGKVDPIRMNTSFPPDDTVIDVNNQIVWGMSQIL